MHISDGILGIEQNLTGIAVTAILTGYTLKKMSHEEIPQTAVMTAAFFVASLVHFKLGPTSVHLLLNGLMGVVLGWRAFPAVVVGLFFQALMFHHGGLVALGVNSLVIGLPALAAGALFRFERARRHIPHGPEVLAFLAGFGAMVFSTLFAAGFLYWNGQEFLVAAKLLIMAELPLALLEGLLTMLTVSYLFRVRPEMVTLPVRNFSRD